MDLPSRPPVRTLLGTALAAAALAVLVPWNLEDPEQALQKTVASALAADDRVLEVALEQYPDRAPAIAITYGHLDLFRDQLARFGPQVVPIVAAYENSFTTADALRIAGQALESVTKQLAGDPGARDLAPITPQDRGLIALLNMREEGNAFVGQWEITDNGEAKRIPSRLVTLAGPELLLGGLTALERRVLQEREIDWRTYGLAAVDVAAIAAGVGVLRLARTATRGLRTVPAASRTAMLPGARDLGEVLGIKAMRFGLPIGLGALMVLHPDVFTQYLWILAESLGLPGVLGPIIGWSIVIVPLAFLLSWALLSVRLLRFMARLLAGVAWGCQVVAGRLAAAGEHRPLRAGAPRRIRIADRA